MQIAEAGCPLTPFLMCSSSSFLPRLLIKPKRIDKSENMDARELKKGVAEFYDETSGLWESIWGDHMHHGFYDLNAEVSNSPSYHRAAQIRMIEEALSFVGISEDRPEKWPKNMVDVGCAIGGSSRYIARKYGAKCQGITLSPYQARRANTLAATEGLTDKVYFQVADAIEQPFPDGQFDLVWSMQWAEHVPEKKKLINELARVAAPGATIIIGSFCHRILGPCEESLQTWEKEHLKKISDAYYLAEWCSAVDYVNLLKCLPSFQDIKIADWSQETAPFGPAVLCSSLSWKSIPALMRCGLKTIKGGRAMPLLIEGCKKGLIKNTIITCRKSE